MKTSAAAFAIKAHGDQKYGDLPYAYHLARVAEEIFNHIDDPTGVLQNAAWLHDTLEDTSVTIEELEREFGWITADFVNAVTGVGKNRKERNRSIYSKLSNCPEAAIIKLADRTANLSHSLETKNVKKMAMYVGEDADFFVAIQPHIQLSDEKKLLLRYTNLISEAMREVPLG